MRYGIWNNHVNAWCVGSGDTSNHLVNGTVNTVDINAAHQILHQMYDAHGEHNFYYQAFMVKEREV